MEMKLERSFYERDTLTVAKELLSCILVHVTPEGITSGKIIETEAYMGPEDKGAHSYRGRHTPRMDPLYKTEDLPTFTSYTATTTASTW